MDQPSEAEKAECMAEMDKGSNQNQSDVVLTLVCTASIPAFFTLSSSHSGLILAAPVVCGPGRVFVNDIIGDDSLLV